MFSRRITRRAVFYLNIYKNILKKFVITINLSKLMITFELKIKSMNCKNNLKF